MTEFIAIRMRVSRELRGRAQTVARRLGLPQTEMLRAAVAIGLDAIERALDADPAAVLAAVRQAAREADT